MPGTSNRLLAVDDDVNSAELIVRIAERCGYEGFATSDSRGVINLANALKPGIISIDICMPNVDAEALLGMLAEVNFEGDVLIVSGQEAGELAKTQRIAEALGLSVIGAMQKPFDIASLRLTLQKASLSRAA